MQVLSGPPQFLAKACPNAIATLVSSVLTSRTSHYGTWCEEAPHKSKFRQTIARRIICRASSVPPAKAEVFPAKADSSRLGVRLARSMWRDLPPTRLTEAVVRAGLRHPTLPWMGGPTPWGHHTTFSYFGRAFGLAGLMCSRPRDGRLRLADRHAPCERTSRNRRDTSDFDRHSSGLNRFQAGTDPLQRQQFCALHRSHLIASHGSFSAVNAHGASARSFRCYRGPVSETRPSASQVRRSSIYIAR